MAKSKASSKNSAIPSTEGRDELPSTPKKFRQSPELEDFYRFIYENDVRKEAFGVINSIYKERLESKKSRGSRKSK